MLNRLRYDMVDDPFVIHSTDPNNVQFRSARASQTNRSRWKDIGHIRGGDWDLESHSKEYAINNDALYRAIEDRYERDIPWKSTDYVEKSLELIRQGDDRDAWRAVVQSEEDLWERCEQLDQLYEQIQREGYKSKREVFATTSDDPMGYYPRTFKYQLDEVMVDSGRDGEPLLVDGHHRLYLAKVCDIDEIPVVVVVRHDGTV